MRINKLFLGILLSISCFAFAQSDKKEVLFTVDNNSYYTDEFNRVYNKNIDLVKDDSQKDLNQYLELFVGYKLKINKANKLGLQNNPKYINELASYRTQLSKNYTSDIKVTKALIEEGYSRSQKEVRASHILFMVDENAAPVDTLKVYNQALEVRKKALSGGKFDELAVQFSQDPSAKENKGDLGYFSAFRMVYAFESAAFKTKAGDISMPIRTRFGYHLVKVVDTRDNRGEITVSHIMITKPTTDSKDDEAKAKATIQDIYTKLKQGENFASLATQFSQDKNSAPKGGVLPKFSSGQLSSEEFENVAFTLTAPDSYSEPFMSQFGWHIVKLIEKHPLKTFAEMEKELDTKIRKDDRSRLITNSLNEKLRKKYTVKRDNKLFEKVKATVNDTFYNSEWKKPVENKDLDADLLTIDGKFKVKGSQFLTELESQQKGNLKIKPIGKLVDFVYNNYVDTQLNTYYNENLESEFSEFSYIIEEYRDGLLLFDLMEKEIWEKAKIDTLGLKDFFTKNNTKYQWKTRSQIIVASSTQEDVVKKAKKMLTEGKTVDAIKEVLNTKDIVNIMIKEDTYEEGADNFPKSSLQKPGVTDTYKDKEFYFVNKIINVLPAGPKTLDETKGRAINDYQQFLEDNWVSDLKKEFKVNINQDVFAKLKKAMKK